MKRLGQWLLGLLIALWAWALRHDHEDDGERIVPPGQPDRRAETLVLALLGVATLTAAGFIVVYAIDSIGNHTQLLGITLGLTFAALATALIVVAKHLIVTEELEEEYPQPSHPEANEKLSRIVRESGSRFTRKRLMVLAGGGAATALGAALVTPALSLGPFLNTSELNRSPWRRGLRLIGSDGLPLFADQIEEKTFYTAFPEHVSRDEIGAPLVVVRLAQGDLKLPADRRNWAPNGIVAYSKICTHAGCAIALYRTPLFPPVEPRPALVCPCHYSTFDPATGGEVLFGPAGRPLPQLPLMVGKDGVLRAAGDFAGPVGPSWSGVRGSRAT